MQNFKGGLVELTSDQLENNLDVLFTITKLTKKFQPQQNQSAKVGKSHTWRSGQP